MLREFYDIVIVGGGKAGSQLAASLRDEGYRGSVLLLGDEATAPYDRPPLSKSYLTGERSAEENLLRPPKFYEQNDIDVDWYAPVESVDTAARSVTLHDGTALGYGELVLATGARVRPLPFPGGTLGGVTGLRTQKDSDALRGRLATAKSLVVIGGGFVGLEVAAVAATTFGCSVTLVEAMPRLMARTGLPETAEHVKEYHETLGIEILLDTQVAEIRADATGHVEAVVTADGTEILADAVVYGVGVDPRTELAVDSDIEIANGILVDEYLHTSAEHVWAIGDCVAFPSRFFGGVVRLESVQNATDQARFLAARLVSPSAGYHAVPWFWSDQADLVLQSAGLTGNRDFTVVVGNPAHGSFSVLAFRDGVMIGGDSVNAKADHLAIRRLLAKDPAEWADALTPELCVSDGFSLKEFVRGSASPKVG